MTKSIEKTLSIATHCTWCEVNLGCKGVAYGVIVRVQWCNAEMDVCRSPASLEGIPPRHHSWDWVYSIISRNQLHAAFLEKEPLKSISWTDSSRSNLDWNAGKFVKFEKWSNPRKEKYASVEMGLSPICVRFFERLTLWKWRFDSDRRLPLSFFVVSCGPKRQLAWVCKLNRSR